MRLSLSYVLATRNKLQFLRNSMPRLIAACLPDEEIIVVDGASIDGSVDYLADLYQRNLIHQYISEFDISEAHAFNKGILLAKGQFIKFITDDDLYYFSEIQHCKRFMMATPSVDALTSNLLSVSTQNFLHIHFHDYENFHRQWLGGALRNYWFCGLPLMIRKDSLAQLGLLSSFIIIPDADYSFRLTTIGNIALYTGYTVARLESSKSVLVPNMKRAVEEYQRIRVLYGYSEPKPTITKRIYNLLSRTKRLLWPKKILNEPINEAQMDISELFMKLEKIMIQKNEEKEKLFLHSVLRPKKRTW